MTVDSATSAMVTPAPMRSPSRSPNSMPLISGRRRRLTTYEGIGNLAPPSFICTTRSVPPASARPPPLPSRLRSCMASARLVGAKYSNLRTPLPLACLLGGAPPFYAEPAPPTTAVNSPPWLYNPCEGGRHVVLHQGGAQARAPAPAPGVAGAHRVLPAGHQA